MWGLLRDRTIRTVWTGEMVNEFGNALNYWALAWLLFRAFPQQPWAAASVLSAQAVGLMVGAAVLGPKLDHWDRRRVLAGSNLTLAGLVALIPLFGGRDELIGLTVVAFLIGFITSLSIPSLQATLPSLVSSRCLQPLLALFGLTFSFSNVAAPLSAGLLIAALGANTVIWLNALSFLFAGACYLLVRFPTQVYAPDAAGPALGRWWAQVGVGLEFVRSRAAVWGIILVVSSVNAFTDPYNALLLPRVAERFFSEVQFPAWLGSDPQAAGLGLFDTVTVNTELLATLWLGARNFPNPLALHYLLLACFLIALGMLGVVLAPTLPLALVFCALQGVGFAPIAVLAGTLLGRLVPEGLRGRVGSVRLFLAQALRPVALSAVGALITPLGLSGITLALFLVVVLLGVGGARAARDL